MKHTSINAMQNGWFIGGFDPTAFNTQACEVALKNYKAGDYEAAHFHKVATEITLIVSGRVFMCGKEWAAGDIVLVEPGESTDFRAITDVTNVVVKLPGALNDKFYMDKF